MVSVYICVCVFKREREGLCVVAGISLRCKECDQENPGLFDLVGIIMFVCVLGTGVTVNAVHPGVVATDLGRHTGMHQSMFSSSVLSKLK